MNASPAQKPSNIRLSRLALAVIALPLALPVMASDEKTLSQVVVTDQREAQVERKNSYVQKIVISEEEIERFGDVSVGDVLKRLPGTSFTGPAGVAKDVRMRGLDKGYTQFMINGEPVPGATKERQMQVDRLPADMIERIEIIRNPSAEYDSGNIGGIVNIVFKQRIDELTRTRIAYGTNGDLEVGDAIVQTSKRWGDIDLLLAASYTKGAEDVVEEKKTFNTTTGAVTGREYKPKPVDKTEFLFTPRLTWRFGEDRLILEPFVSKGTEDKTETNTVDKSNVVTSRVSTTENKDDTIARLAGRYEGKTAWGNWYAKAGSQKTTSEKDKVTYTRSYNATTGVYSGATRATEYEELEETINYLGAGVVIPFANIHRLSTGVELRYSDYSSRKPKTSQSISAAGVPGAVVDKSGVRDKFDITEEKQVFYVQDEINLFARHWLTPGVRYERISREAQGGNNVALDSTTNASNPSLHYRWAILDDFNFRSSYAQTLKLPKFDQLNPLIESKTGNASDPDKGGNAALNPEKAKGVEAGFEKLFMGNRGIAGINFYNRDVKDFIEERTKLEGARYVKRPYNVGDAHFWGAEIDWRFPLYEKRGHVLNLVGNHSEMRGRIESASGAKMDVKDMPERVTNLGLDYRHRPTASFAGFSVNYVPKFTKSSLNDDGVLEQKTTLARTGLDLYFGKAFSPKAEVRFVARNVLSVDKEERTLKRNAAGAVTSDEWKVERSRPTLMLTFESRF